MVNHQGVNHPRLENNDSLNRNKLRGYLTFDVAAWCWRCRWRHQCLQHLNKHPGEGRSYCSCSHPSEVSQLPKSLVCLPRPSLASPLPCGKFLSQVIIATNRCVNLLEAGHLYIAPVWIRLKMDHHHFPHEGLKGRPGLCATQILSMLTMGIPKSSKVWHVLKGKTLVWWYPE